MTLDQLRNICPYSAGMAAAFVDALTAAMAEFEINTARRQAAFVAQVAHETGEFRYMREIDSGAAYEGRADLGNTQPGADAPDFVVVNFTLYSHDLVKNLDVSASVYSLLNDKYDEPATRFHLQNVIPQDGTTFRVKLTYHF